VPHPCDAARGPVDRGWRTRKRRRAVRGRFKSDVTWCGRGEGPELSVPDRVPAFPPGPLLNRERRWLEFDARVLEKRPTSNPWLERLKSGPSPFHLDEFFEIRVGGCSSRSTPGVDPRTMGADADGPGPSSWQPSTGRAPSSWPAVPIMNRRVLPASRRAACSACGSRISHRCRAATRDTLFAPASPP